MEKTHDVLIRKQAVLDTVEFMYEACDTWDIKDYHDLMVEAISVLPSAEPQIIRCKDCRHSVDVYDDGDCYCLRPGRPLMWVGDWTFFCKAAERSCKAAERREYGDQYSYSKAGR